MVKNSSRTKRTDILVNIAVILIAFLAFWNIYGLQVLDPAYHDWLLTNGGDDIQHYVGADAFRRSSWTFPIGNMDTLNYPDHVSVIFYDAIPLCALITRIFHSILPPDFQYFGIWGLLCFILQGLFAVKIMRKFTGTPLILILSAMLFIHAPVMVFRIFGHEALGAHWLILWTALLLVYYEEKYNKFSAAVTLIALLGFITPFIHMYFFPICGIVILCWCVYDFLNTKKILRPLIAILCYTACAMLAVFLLGGFDTDRLGAGGLGTFSLNLNAFFNSMDHSAWVKTLRFTQGQQEGFAYLGLAQLCLIVMITILLFTEYKEKLTADKKKLLAVLCVSAICILLSLSNVISFGDRILLTIPLPAAVERLISTFRSTGRFIWPVYYLLMIYPVAAGSKYLKPRTVTVLLLVCFLCQRIELAPLYSRNMDNRTLSFPEKNVKWNEIIDTQNIQHLVIIGDPGSTRGKFYQMGTLAAKRKLTMNRFVTAHNDNLYDQQAAAEAIRSRAEGNLFIFLEEIDCVSYPQLRFYLLDDFIIGIDQDRQQPDLPPLEGQDFEIPFSRLSIQNGEVVNSMLCLYENGVSQGPGLYLPKGEYKLAVYGEQTDACEYQFLPDDPDQHAVSYEIIQSDDETVIIHLTAEKDLESFDLRITNTGDSARIRSVILTIL